MQNGAFVMNGIYSEMTDTEALFCDETEGYRTPFSAEPGEEITLWFRTAADGADIVLLRSADKPSVASDSDGDVALCFMKRAARSGRFDYWQAHLRLPEKKIYYSFEVRRGREACLYGKTGVEPGCALDNLMTWHPFSMIPGFRVPEWSRGAVMYQIFVDRFRNGDPSNDVINGEYLYLGERVRHAEWDSLPEKLDVGRFYGGDLEGVRQELDYLKDLGVEAIYLNPIFVSPSNHKYDCQDYFHVDPHLTLIPKDVGKLVQQGEPDNRKAERYINRTADPVNLGMSDWVFANFVNDAHDMGIRVIIDGVFNHCGSFHRWMDRENIYGHQGGYPIGAFKTKDSPYSHYFRFSTNEWPDNDSYEGWWGVETLPKLNYEEAPNLVRAVMDIGQKWVSPPYGADGWRLDVAADLGHSEEYNHEFWKLFRKRVKEANPDAVILAEHYGDPSSWLGGDQWDSVMNYDAFMEPVSWFLTGMEKHSDRSEPHLFGNGPEFFRTMRENMSRFSQQSLECAMNQLDNHDHSRFMTRTNRTVGRLDSLGADAASMGTNRGIFRQGIVMLMTWPGAPTYYYGDEIALCGWTDPDSRRSYPWEHQDLEMIEFCCCAARMRRELPALRRGSVIELSAGDGFIVYGRMGRGAESSRVVICINTSHEEAIVHVPVWKLDVRDEEVMRRYMLTTEKNYNVGVLEFPIRNGMFRVALPPVSSSVFAVGERTRGTYDDAVPGDPSWAM